MKWIIGPVGLVLSLLALSAHGAEPKVTGYHLRPASAVTISGKTVKLKLVLCKVEEASKEKKEEKSGDKPKDKYAGDDLAPLVQDKYTGDDLAPLVPIPPDNVSRDKGKRKPSSRLVCEGDPGWDGDLAPLVAVPTNVQWKVDGPGRVSSEKMGATYHAPASKPTPDEATVTATLTFKARKEILYARIKIIDKVMAYAGRFSLNDVSVNNEYTRKLAGTIRWEFDEYYEEGRWREYTGKGAASVSIERIGCGGPASFTGVPVEGRLKVYDDKKYEFLINLVSDEERKRLCRRPELDKDLKWEEPFTAAGEGMSSGDPCGLSEFYPRYTDILTLASGRNGNCGNNHVRNRYQEGWSFRAVK
ncbi:MAG: hypothetical protein JSW09_11300 [Pseudomonadota bacterium]|nr:MAG: hypothetical protein JSW09_11300 [Pseudomonadota bacterium]